MNELQAYMVHEYVADYKAGYLSRRDLVRRVLNITGGVGTTATLLLALGCSTPAAQPTSAPAATAAPKPTAAAAASPAASAVAVVSPAPSPAAAASPSVAAKPAASPAASPSIIAVGSPSPVARSPLSVAANDPTVDGQDISFPGADGAKILAYQARPKSASGPLPLVLVCHENRGLTEHIRDVVRRYTKEGFMACGVDLVSRQGGTNAITDPNQFSALLTGQGVNPDQFVSDFASAVAYYKTKPDLAQLDKIGMNGFCFGGGVVWRSTEQIPELKAAVPFYGAYPPLDQVSKIKAAVLGVYSSDPNDFANAMRDQLDQALTAAGVTHKFNVYPGTMHAFHNDTGAAYNQEQALAAWRDAIAWFHQYLA
ncbi:MAG: dienelactone hydrolase family protein [Chloroflexi bacterium]|nr:dienelactone hydrolase family protein [Chloroflexota bacterium]